ncbi:hypothetical protein ABZP36_030669 [Zizania latifolia]
MAATVVESRKRGFASFVDDPMRFLDGPHPLPSQQAKRGRCSPSAASLANLGVSMELDPVDVLQLIFPDADPQVTYGGSTHQSLFMPGARVALFLLHCLE